MASNSSHPQFHRLWLMRRCASLQTQSSLANIFSHCSAICKLQSADFYHEGFLDSTPRRHPALSKSEPSLVDAFSAILHHSTAPAAE